MLKSKNTLSIVLVCLLATTLIPMIPRTFSGATTLQINKPTLPSGHAGHVAWLNPEENGFWFNTGTPAAPVWTQMPWGTNLAHDPDFPAGEFHVRVAAQIRDSQGGNPNNGQAHSFQVQSFPGTTVVYGPVAMPADGGITVPTYFYILDPAGPVVTTPALKRSGPQIDLLRFLVITSPDAALIAMQTGTADVLGSLASPMDVFWHKLAEAGDQLRSGDIEKLSADGHYVSYDQGFHIGHIVYNIRPQAAFWPLADVDFRHALFHCFDQQTILDTIKQWTVTPLYDLVPPAQGGWVNPNVPKHPFYQGSPLDSTTYPAEHSSCAILRAAGYTFQDIAPTGVGPEDYWNDPNGNPLPTIILWTPLPSIAPTSYAIGAWFLSDLGEIGLAATTANGASGMQQVAPPGGFAWYKNLVEQGLFDAAMVFWNIARFPDYLYDMLHSSQDASLYPGRNNIAGIIDPLIDNYVETILTSLNHTEKLNAAYATQERMYNSTASNQALAYMPLYSRIHFNGYNKDLRGIVNSPGFGSHNKWTLLNIRWAPGSAGELAHRVDEDPGTPVVYDDPPRYFINWILQDVPGGLLFNPLYEQSKYSWAVMSPVMDGLMMVNPFTHEDLSWLAESWECVETPYGPGAMNVTFELRRDVFWQDGNPFTANDVAFNWLFLRDNQIPRFNSTGRYIQNVVVIDDYTVRVTLSNTSQFLIYDLAATAAMLPPCVWSWLNGQPLPVILGYSPSTNTTRPNGAGPWFGTPQGPSTQLFATGPFVFDFYNPNWLYSELHQFPGYFRITDDIQAQKVEMFHRVGDCSSGTQGVGYSDGIVWADDRGQIGMRYGTNKYLDPLLYHPYVDLNSDDWIDTVDLSLANFHFGQKREYP